MSLHNGVNHIVQLLCWQTVLSVRIQIEASWTNAIGAWVCIFSQLNLNALLSMKRSKCRRVREIE